jgi:hypothetical protein
MGREPETPHAFATASLGAPPLAVFAKGGLFYEWDVQDFQLARDGDAPGGPRRKPKVLAIPQTGKFSVSDNPSLEKSRNSLETGCGVGTSFHSSL